MKDDLLMFCGLLKHCISFLTGGVLVLSHAHIKDPSLGLFDALRIGGFEYEYDNDSGCVDAEQITLGQRKNQLSRRIRLAKKKESEAIQQQQQQQQQGRQVTSPSASRSSKQKPVKRQRSSKTKKSTAAVSSSCERKRPPPPSTNTTTTTSPQGSDSDALDDSDFVDPASATLAGDDADTQDARIRAKWHPDYKPIAVPPSAFSTTAAAGTSGTGLDRDQQAISAAAADAAARLLAPPPPLPPPPGSHHPLAAPAHHSHHAAEAVAAAAASVLSPPFCSTASLLASRIMSQAGGAPHHSAVAVSSLSRTAASVGMTLEQFAMALSTAGTNQLLTMLADGPSTGLTGPPTLRSHSSDGSYSSLLAGGSSSDLHRYGQQRNQKREELALNLYLAESRTLLERCMLLAGYPAEDLVEGSANHTAMRLAVWQSHGKQLQDCGVLLRQLDASANQSTPDQGNIAPDGVTAEMPPRPPIGVLPSSNDPFAFAGPSGAAMMGAGAQQHGGVGGKEWRQPASDPILNNGYNINGGGGKQQASRTAAEVTSSITATTRRTDGQQHYGERRQQQSTAGEEVVPPETLLGSPLLGLFQSRAATREQQEQQREQQQQEQQRQRQQRHHQNSSRRRSTLR